MAAPITHIVLSKLVYGKYFSRKDKKVFFVGTSFPDIRYLGVIEREKTHFKEMNLNEVVASDAFEAGLKFHSLVDKIREKFVVRRGLYSLFPESPVLTQAVKAFEDRVLYGKVVDWEVVRDDFDKVLEDELNFGIEKRDIERWHVLLRHYFSEDPSSDSTIYQFVADMGRPKEMADEMVRVLNGVGDEKKAREIVEDFYDRFEDLIAEEK